VGKKWDSFKDLCFDFFEIYKHGPWDFLIWFIMSILVALIGVWLPFFVNHIIFDDLANILLKIGLIESLDVANDKLYMYKKIMQSNPFVLFSITFLAEALVSLISIRKAKDEAIKFGPMKLILGIFTGIYLTILAGLIVILEIFSISLNDRVQLLILIITIILGIILYPLKANLYEPTPNALTNKQTQSINQIQNKASNITQTKDGIAL
jgi:hypothetical protein